MYVLGKIAVTVSVIVLLHFTVLMIILLIPPMSINYISSFAV